jgi:hypothetical protein
VAVGTGGYVAFQAFTSTGPQPAQALPADTLGYVSVDLDPSFSQKVDALRTLDKFPSFRDHAGISSTDDLREKLFERIQDSGACPGVSYASDVAPWLGDRFAFAAVPLAEKDDQGQPEVAPVAVVQVKDADAAQAGLEKLRTCAGPDTDSSDVLLGWAVEGDWVVVADSDETAQEVVDHAGQATLADDGDYRKWTGAAGDPGIVTAYAAPAARDYLARATTLLSGFARPPAALSCPVPLPAAVPTTSPSVPGTVPSTGALPCTDSPSDQPDPPDTPALQQAFASFDGAAVTVRFANGSLEVEAVGAGMSPAAVGSSGQAGEAVSTLPADTAAAMGLGLQPGWFTQLTDYLSQVSGGLVDLGAQLDEVEQQTGLTFPDDAETLLGSSTAIALGPNLTQEALQTGRGLPLAVKVKGDPAAIQSVIDKLTANGTVPAEAAPLLQTATNGDYVTAALDPAYRDQVSAGGDLGSNGTFTSVVPHAAEASQIFYVDFDSADWLSRAITESAGDDPTAHQIAADVEPLKALGFSSWDDGGTQHSLLKITTD